MARKPARKITILKPSPAQIAGARIAGSAWVVSRRKGCCGRPSAERIWLKVPIGTGW